MNESKYLMISDGANNIKNSPSKTNIENETNNKTNLVDSSQSEIMNSKVDLNTSNGSVVNSTFDKSLVNNNNKTNTQGTNDNSDSEISDEKDEIVVLTYEPREKKKVVDQTVDINPLSKYFNGDSHTNGRWSRSVEGVILDYKKKAIGYKVLYNNSYYKYMKLYRLFKWPLVFFTLISLVIQVVRSTLLSSDSVGSTDAYRFVMNIVTTVVTGLIAMFTYLQTDKNYKNSAYGCKKASSAFGTLSEEIGTILSIPRSSRANPFQVLSGIQSDLTKLIKLHEDYEIPASIYNEFDKKYNTDVSSNATQTKTQKKTKMFGKNKIGIDENEILEKFVENVQNVHNDIEMDSMRQYI